MSTYGGKFIDERLKNICIDNFLPDNYDCTAFFLSHFHSDHMRGIYEATFHSLFERKSVYFYCHKITRQFIIKCDDIKIPNYKIKTLDKHGTDVEIEDGVWIKVYNLPAGHCPGSVMLLFDGLGERVLYSGDIRIPENDLIHLDTLHLEGEVLPIDSLYLDTTFASPMYLNFPTRRQSLNHIKQHIDSWLNKGGNNRLCILSTACIGIEFLMIELSEMYDSKVHVSNDSYDRFISAIDMLKQVTTTNPHQAKIHFCSVGKCEVCFRSIYSNDELLLIKPSALYFTQDIIQKHGDVFFDTRAKILRVCYSSHASCQELVQFVKYLKPKRVYPCVIPPFTNKDNPYQFFDEFLELCSLKDSNNENISDQNKHLSSSKDKDFEEYSSLNDSEIFIKVVDKYLMRPVDLPQQDYSELIRQLEVETPT